MKTLLLALTLCVVAFADGDCIERPCQVATNVADRITGKVDLRPNQFGLAEAVEHDVEFFPPSGYRTRIVKLHGDFIGWFVEKGGFEELFTMWFDPTQGLYRSQVRKYSVGMLTSLRHTGPEGSNHGWPVADNAMVYRQHVLDRWNTTARLDYSEPIINGRLRSDNILRIVHAVFNNTSEKHVQMETTVQIQFVFEPLGKGLAKKFPIHLYDDLIPYRHNCAVVHVYPDDRQYFDNGFEHFGMPYMPTMDPIDEITW